MTSGQFALLRCFLSLCFMSDKSGKQNCNFAFSKTVADAKYAVHTYRVCTVQCDVHNASHVQCTNASIMCLGRCCHRWKRLYLYFAENAMNKKCIYQYRNTHRDVLTQMEEPVNVRNDPLNRVFPKVRIQP